MLYVWTKVLHLFWVSPQRMTNEFQKRSFLWQKFLTLKSQEMFRKKGLFLAWISGLLKLNQWLSYIRSWHHSRVRQLKKKKIRTRSFIRFNGKKSWYYGVITYNVKYSNQVVIQNPNISQINFTPGSLPTRAILFRFTHYERQSRVV